MAATWTPSPHSATSQLAIVLASAAIITGLIFLVYLRTPQCRSRPHCLAGPHYVAPLVFCPPLGRRGWLRAFRNRILGIPQRVQYLSPRQTVVLQQELRAALDELADESGKT